MFEHLKSRPPPPPRSEALPATQKHTTQPAQASPVPWPLFALSAVSDEKIEGNHFDAWNKGLQPVLHILSPAFFLLPDMPYLGGECSAGWGLCWSISKLQGQGIYLHFEAAQLAI